MANKPAQICQLQKGKLIDTQKGFVDTFNWAVQSIANLKGGENCEVTWPTDDTPTIDCTATEGSGDNDSGGGGAITIAGTDGSSHEGDTFTFESATDSNVIVTVDGDGVMKIGVYYL